MVQGGHETYIRNLFLGQHIIAGAIPTEKEFNGVSISLMGNDNVAIDVVIISHTLRFNLLQVSWQRWVITIPIYTGQTSECMIPI
jgi:hypothetical protein